MNGFQSDLDGDYIEKKAGSILDYGFIWEKWLSNDTIASSTWSLPSPLTEVSKSFDGTTTAVIISGGLAGTSYTVTNTITTSKGLTDSRSFRLFCVS